MGYSIIRNLFICFLLLFLKSSFAGGCWSGEENEESIKKEDCGRYFDELDPRLLQELFLHVFDKEAFRQQFLAWEVSDNSIKVLQKNVEMHGYTGHEIPINFNGFENGLPKIVQVGSVLNNAYKPSAEKVQSNLDTFLCLNAPSKTYTCFLRAGDLNNISVTSACLSVHGDLVITWKDNDKNLEYVKLFALQELKENKQDALNLAYNAKKLKDINSDILRGNKEFCSEVKGSLFLPNSSLLGICLIEPFYFMRVDSSNKMESYENSAAQAVQFIQVDSFPLTKKEQLKRFGIWTQSFVDKWRKQKEKDKENQNKN